MPTSIKSITLKSINVDMRMSGMPPLEGYLSGVITIVYQDDDTEDLNVSWQEGPCLECEHKLKEKIEEILDNDSLIEEYILSKLNDVKFGEISFYSDKKLFK